MIVKVLFTVFIQSNGKPSGKRGTQHSSIVLVGPASLFVQVFLIQKKQKGKLVRKPGTQSLKSESPLEI
jgi:hypothetical protein